MPLSYKARMDRRHPRQAVDRPAKIFLGSSEGLVCRIRDISKGGAKISIAWTGWLPDSFDLEDSFTSVRREVWVVWREPLTSACALPTRGSRPRSPSLRRLAGGSAKYTAQPLSSHAGGEDPLPARISRGPITPFGAFCMRGDRGKLVRYLQAKPNFSCHDPVRRQLWTRRPARRGSHFSGSKRSLSGSY